MADWKNGERYNSLGEFNPRLIPCDNCGIYREPERLKSQDSGEYWCLTCATQLKPV